MLRHDGNVPVPWEQYFVLLSACTVLSLSDSNGLIFMEFWLKRTLRARAVFSLCALPIYLPFGLLRCLIVVTHRARLLRVNFFVLS